MASVVALVSADAVSSGKLVLPQAAPPSARVRQVSGLSGADVIVTIKGQTMAFLVMQPADWDQENHMDRFKFGDTSVFICYAPVQCHPAV